MSIFAQIETLAHEQQYLWQEARHKRLNSVKRQRMTSIKTELAHLWHLYRCEMADDRRKQWRQESKLHGINPDVTRWLPGDLDSFSVDYMKSMLRTEYKLLHRKHFDQVDKEWVDRKYAAERKHIEKCVADEMGMEADEQRRIRQVVSQLVNPAHNPQRTFNPREMSLRQLRQHRLQPHREFSLVGAL